MAATPSNMLPLGTPLPRFTLPNTVDTDQIHASAEHGVLTVTLPKVERARPKEIPIKSSNGKERQEVRTQK